MIFYALIGMPVNMILYTYLGEYFGSNVSEANQQCNAILTDRLQFFLFFI